MNEFCLEIFVSAHCFVCDYAHTVAELIRTDYPWVKLQVIDIHDPTATVPEQVFATPTYILNGKVWSLGNPSPEKIAETLSQTRSARSRTYP